MKSFYNNHKQVIRWIALNISLAGMLALTFKHGPETIYGDVLFICVWAISLSTIPSALLVLALGTSAMCESEKAREALLKYKISVPLSVNTAFDAVYCFALVWLGWYGTSLIYLVHAILGTIALQFIFWLQASMTATKEIGQ